MEAIAKYSVKREACKECKHCKETMLECYLHSKEYKKMHPIKYKQFNGNETPWC
jgi:hypothetical protein